MKIEKLTENKIRIILKQDDFKNKSINFQKLIFTEPETQSLFLEILNKAKREMNFDTDGYKLLIEAFLQNSDIFVFTITKYDMNSDIIKNIPKTPLGIKRKNIHLKDSCYIYQFSSFDDFCNYCNYINNTIKINLENLFKCSLLYLYNDTYYLLIDDLTISNEALHIFHSSLIEFSIFSNFSKNFKTKLEEHGKVIIKNNAINTGIQYFS